MAENQLPDIDPTETQEWLDALQAVIDQERSDRARFILSQLLTKAGGEALGIAGSAVTTAYLNSIAESNQAEYPGDLEIEARIRALIRWNAIAMVVKAGKIAPDVGGHIASYASAAILYEVGFNHFFRAPDEQSAGDMVFVQGHCSPGIYARAFLEGRLSEQQLINFRQEVEKDGLSSYPHPWLMPDFWQFPTVSMGLGPLQAIYQARLLKYLHNRELLDTTQRKVWMFCGDGEMDEPESMGALNRASREGLDNLIFVINCNLQRLDGPVWGNGKIIQEFEGVFRGAGWHVIKVVWDSNWQALIDKDTSGRLAIVLDKVIDGEYQNFMAKGGSYIREYLTTQEPALTDLLATVTDEQLTDYTFGGHDPEKVYAAYHAAVNNEGSGRPTVILAKSVKGFGMGPVGQAQNTTHQQKKLNDEQLKVIRDRFNIPVTDDAIPSIPFCQLEAGSPEHEYLHQRRKDLGGYLPVRKPCDDVLAIPALTAFGKLLESSGEREISTTMAFVRALNVLVKDKNIGKQVVPIIPDECRTFGMEGMFRQLGIYSPLGQQYTPVDSEQVMYYKEDIKGQVLEEGITEAGAFCSWMAAATSYANNHYPMIPFYIYYSMFGFQRVGDLAWAAGDMQARGFLLGATAGRTTLAGEGLQHQDGHQLLYAATIPNCIAYDPTFSYEVAVIIQDGLRRMYQNNENVFYYLTLMNENYHHPAMPEGAEEGIIKGMYLLQSAEKSADGAKVQLLGSGTILREVIAAAEILQRDYNVSADIWSVTSFNELRRDGLDVERWNRLHPTETAKQSYVAQQLADRPGPVVAATDYMAAYSDQIRSFISQPYTTIGTDGYGRSDTREQLRHFFEVDSKYIVVATLKALADCGDVNASIVDKAINALGIDPDKPNPVTV